MQFFIGIAPPDEYKQQIECWTSNGLRNVVEPHITVKAQSGLTPDLGWLNNVKHACSSFPNFRLGLAAPSTYGTAVAFLSVESIKIFELHMQLMNAVSPSTEDILPYELDGFHPHLTLGQTRWGMEESEVTEMIEKASTDLLPFPTFDVTFVRVYQEIETNKYVPFEDIRLAYWRAGSS